MIMKNNNLFWRAIILFSIGAIFTFILSLLQSHQNYSKSGKLNFGQWWLPFVCGIGSALVGLIYPCLKSKDSDLLKSQEWSHVLRCVAIFMGINEACTKVEFPSYLHLSVSLGVLSIGLWWYFDRTPIGFGMGVIVATIAILIAEVSVYNQICIYTNNEFSYLKAWLPSVMFSGAITMANIGEKLAMSNNYESENKSHAE